MIEEGISGLKLRLLALLKKEAFKKGQFTLSSGKTSNYYLDGRIITLSPEGAYLVASIILEMIKDKGIDAIGGPTLGADPIVGAVACLSQINHIPINTFIVRKSTKEHGTQRQIEGPVLKKGSRVILVDDQNNAVRLLSKSQIYLESFSGRTVTAVGDYNACGQELTVLDNGIENFDRL